MDQRLSADEGLDVFYLSQQCFLGLVEYPCLVGDLRLGFFGEIRDLYFCLLLYLHQIFLDLLYFSLILSDFLIKLLLLQVLLLLSLLDLYVQVLLLLE